MSKKDEHNLEDIMKHFDNVTNRLHFTDRMPHVTSLTAKLDESISSLFHSKKQQDNGMVKADEKIIDEFARVLYGANATVLAERYLGLQSQKDMDALMKTLNVKTEFGQEIFKKAFHDHVMGLGERYIKERLIATANANGGYLSINGMKEVIGEMVGKHKEVYQQGILEHANISAMVQREVIPYLQYLSQDLGQETGRQPEVPTAVPSNEKMVEAYMRVVKEMPRNYAAKVAERFKAHGEKHH